MDRRFVPLPENRSAHQAVDRLAAAAARGADFPLLFLHGPPGSGKSHLASTGSLNVSPRASRRGRPRPLAAAELGRDLLQPPTERRAVAREAVAATCSSSKTFNTSRRPPATSWPPSWIGARPAGGPTLVDGRFAGRPSWITRPGCRAGWQADWSSAFRHWARRAGDSWRRHCAKIGSCG